MPDVVPSELFLASPCLRSSAGWKRRVGCRLRATAPGVQHGALLVVERGAEAGRGAPPDRRDGGAGGLRGVPARQRSPVAAQGASHIGGEDLRHGRDPPRNTGTCRSPALQAEVNPGASAPGGKRGPGRRRSVRPRLARRWPWRRGGAAAVACVQPTLSALAEAARTLPPEGRNSDGLAPGQGTGAMAWSRGISRRSCALLLHPPYISVPGFSPSAASASGPSSAAGGRSVAGAVGSVRHRMR